MSRRNKYQRAVSRGASEGTYTEGAPITDASVSLSLGALAKSLAPSEDIDTEDAPNEPFDEPPDPDEEEMAAESPRAPVAPEEPMPATEPATKPSTSDSELLSAVKDLFATRTANTVARVEHLRTKAELPSVQPFTCLACGLVPGVPGFCRSCTGQAKVNANPRIQTAIAARPPGVPMIAWHAALAALLARRPPKAQATAVMAMLDQHLPLLRATLMAAFKAIDSVELAAS